MKHRVLGNTGWDISEIGLGTWQVGGGWGQPFDPKHAETILETAIEQGITFFDTADVYDGGASEAAVGAIKRVHGDRIRVATKCGRKLSPHVADEYTPEAIRGFVEDSLSNTGLERIDLIQLHCPPTEVYYRPEIFEACSRLIEQGKIGAAGVSVEKVEEALKAIEYDVVSSVQIIFNMFRHRPSELFFREAGRRNVGVIVRVPLASGLLSGKFSLDQQFVEGDHRNFNREGKAFDKGETFSGVPFEQGVKAAEEIRATMGDDVPLAERALQWILSFPEVSTVIPGASKPEQVLSNVSASGKGPLSEAQLAAVRRIYEDRILPEVHHRW